MKTKFLILIAFVLLEISGYSQDIIFEKDGTIIWANILEYSKDEIKYRLYDKPESSVHVLSADYVVKVIYDSTGRKKDSLEVAADAGKNVVTNSLTIPAFPASAISYRDPESINFNRHCIWLNVTDYLAGMLTISYEHISKSGLFSYTIPFSIGLKSPDLNQENVKDQPYNYYNNCKNYTMGLNLNFYPAGQGRVKYFLGASFEIGSYIYYNTTTSTSYDTIRYQYSYSLNPVYNSSTQREHGSYIAILFQNGINFQLPKSFNISLNCGLGWTHNNYSPSFYQQFLGISETPDLHSEVAGRASICISYKF